MRIMGDSRENERRISEEVNRQGRRQKLLYEAESSARQNAAVAMKWSALFDKEIPQELLQEIEMQRDTCDRIIQSKDRLIKEFKTELKAKDDEYVKSLKKQAEDIDLLLERMGRQYGMLRKAFEDELDDVETAFMQERHELMTANGTELTSLMERRKEQEERYMEARRGRVEEHQLQLQAQRVYVRAANSHPRPRPQRTQAAPGPGRRAPRRAFSSPLPAQRQAPSPAGRRGLQHLKDQDGDGDSDARAAARGDASHLPAQPGEARLQLPRARRARLGEHQHHQAAEEEAHPHGD